MVEKVHFEYYGYSHGIIVYVLYAMSNVDDDIFRFKFSCFCNCIIDALLIDFEMDHYKSSQV